MTSGEIAFLVFLCLGFGISLGLFTAKLISLSKDQT